MWFGNEYLPSGRRHSRHHVYVSAGRQLEEGGGAGRGLRTVAGEYRRHVPLSHRVDNFQLGLPSNFLFLFVFPLQCPSVFICSVFSLFAPTCIYLFYCIVPRRAGFTQCALNGGQQRLPWGEEVNLHSHHSPLFI